MHNKRIVSIWYYNMIETWAIWVYSILKGCSIIESKATKPSQKQSVNSGLCKQGVWICNSKMRKQCDQTISRMNPHIATNKLETNKLKNAWNSCNLPNDAH